MQPGQKETSFIFVARSALIEAPAPASSITFAYEEPDPDDQETLVTRDIRAGRWRNTSRPRSAARSRLSRAGTLHRVGWTETLERLERFLA